jgi:hypothetical protein
MEDSIRGTEILGLGPRLGEIEVSHKLECVCVFRASRKDESTVV